jgi:hemolysin activation/secretion protein
MELGADGGLVVGIGPAIVWDNRDSDFAAKRGGEYAAAALFFPDAIGDYGFGLYTLSARHFLTLVGDHVLAGQIYGQFSNGDVPFQAMPKLGGAERMRGFFQGRYRDKHMVASQLEYRFPVWWRFGAAVFGGVGDVAPTLGAFELDSLEYVGGGGVRFSLSQKDRVNLRFDFGVTSEGNGNLYISLGEAF